ncbi:MAG TPA: 5-(carboxyamino)imidazole ribonucleotide synthase [Pyrinomonadaceae bacterium]|nr:5-(carboxyamino)imidazole ribonucleotide synthase [Pyrinomonadaceae bacterium]
MIAPNSTIGVFGSGQLGRMFAIEARKMGYRVHTFSPESDTPTGQVADIETTAPYDDLDAVRKFASVVDVVTFEFENVPSVTVDAAAQFVDVHPRGEILHTTQNRLREKSFLEKAGFPMARFRHIKVIEDLYAAADTIGLPAVLKTTGFGYDGKGQVKLAAVGDIEAAYESLDGRDAVFEEFVEFEKEVSVVCARGIDRAFTHYGVIENEHTDHILDVSFAPAVIPVDRADAAVGLTRSIAEALDYVGTLCVEFFLAADGRLLINELAPRPHNSGHLTFDACVTSQFEQQLRAVCGLPLGSTALFRPAAMANLLGDIWAKGEPNWASLMSDPNIKLHLYGKVEPRKRRKMGHLTTMASNAAAAAELAREARNRLSPMSK